ncbi:WD repeat-containing protein 46 [Notothenia coriiceps]|uniref:WD repeat-containing protein 46 n=1 Tax=Notothenia coriiceps TaxID=8208 RepID=A0A6I9P6I4_9TELE|nr:PREDICTED: WD repeat-containing protein 46 [Notothenia coriiceps]
MAATSEAVVNPAHVDKTKKPPARYWDEPQEGKDENKVGKDGEQTGETLPQKHVEKAKKRKNDEDRGDAKKFISGKPDPFPGPAHISKDRMQKFKRRDKTKKIPRQHYKLKDMMARSDEVSEMAQKQAARIDLLLPEDAGFLEGDEDEDTCTISQEDISDAVDITSASKYFDLKLSQFGPYRLDYSRTGRHLLLGGRRGHIACIDWQTKRLMCEINVMESINDVKWLHSEAMYAVAQKKWLYIYDSNGIELHCIRKFNDVLRMQFLPYHFLLATVSATSFLQYLDVSVGKEVAAINTKTGRLDVMCQNPQNAIVHLGHSNGTVTLWSPNQKEALVKMLCHQGAVRSVAVDKTGAGEPNFDGLDSNPYRSAKQRQEWEVKALLEKIHPELITLDPTELGQVDQATFQQKHQDRVQALGFDPLAKEKFVPRYKKKGRSSAGSIERRKRQVANEDLRETVQQSSEDKMKIEKERKEREKKEVLLSSKKSALDRFKK